MANANSQPSRIALVTGASKGLGRAIAEKLAADGHRVIVNYFSSAREAEDVVATIARTGGQAIALKADVRDAAQIAAMLDTARRHFGGPAEVLINNATGPQPMKPLEAYSWQDFQDQLDFFVKAPLLLAQALVPEMKKIRWGRIIHIGSEVVELGNADFSAYVAAKGAMLGLTRAWATELGPWQITVNNVAPGWIPVERHAGTPKESLDGYAAQLPLRRQGVPAEIADTVSFIASDASRFITGQTLAVNGGNTFS